MMPSPNAYDICLLLEKPVKCAVHAGDAELTCSSGKIVPRPAPRVWTGSEGMAGLN